MNYRHILLEVEEGVATVTFNRPEVKNSLDVETLQEIHEALGSLEDRSDVGALVITGTGDAFCAGVNLKGYDLNDREAFRSGFREVALWWHQMLHRIVRIPMPVLAAVNGIAVGGGLGLTLAADMAICNDTARFYASWMSNGIANDGGSSYTLTRILGFRRAMELMLTNRTLDAREAEEWGIVNRVYEGPRFEKMKRSIGRQLAAGPTHLQAMVKETFHDGWRRPLEECTEHECMNILTSLDNPYAADRLNAFWRGERTDSIQVNL
ncbi:MAG: enoyl-CoA hydratase/isomerase family protein [Acidimicrobiia bacterium]